MKKGVSKGPDQGALRSTELCVFPPSKFIRQQIDAFSFRILQALKVSNPKISNFLFFGQFYSKAKQKDTPFKIPSLYIEKCLYIGNPLPPKIDQKNKKFQIFGLDTFKACKILNKNASICYLMNLDGGKTHNSVDLTFRQ